MTKNSKNALILLVSVFALVAILISIRFLPDKKNSFETRPDTQALNIVNEQIDKISSVDIINDYGAYSFIKKSNDQWEIKELEKYTLSNHAMDELNDKLINFMATKIVSNDLSHLEIYGLAAAQTKVILNYNDNVKSAISIGNQAPGGAGYYVFSQDKETVYLVSEDVVLPFLKSKLDYISLAVTSPNNPDLALESLDYIELISDQKIKIIFYDQKDDKNIYKITEPKEMVLNDNESYMVESAENISAQKIECIDAAEDDINNYNLSNPKIKLNLKYKNQEATCILIAPANQNNDYFVMKQGEDVIYRVNNDNLEFLNLLTKVLETNDIDN